MKTGFPSRLPNGNYLVGRTGIHPFHTVHGGKAVPLDVFTAMMFPINKKGGSNGEETRKVF